MRGIYQRFNTCKPEKKVEPQGVTLTVAPKSFHQWPNDLGVDENDGYLELGGPLFEEVLIPLEKIALTIARCSDQENHDCLSQLPDNYSYVLEQGMQDKVEALDTYYLLVAAAAVHGASTPNDLFSIQPSYHQRHLPRGKQDIVNERLKSLFGTTAEGFRGPAPTQSKGSQHTQFYELADHAWRRAPELQEKVERIACAYPPFFHVVPLWDQKWEGKWLRAAAASEREDVKPIAVDDAATISD